MAIDAYMWFQDYNGKYLASESQIDFSKEGNKAVKFPPTPGSVFEVVAYSFDIEQTLSIGSQSTGAGAGKVTFNPFSIVRKVDKSSPVLFQMACSGTPFQLVTLVIRKAAGTAQSVFIRYTFKLVAVKTISTANADESVNETITFEYGGLVTEYWPQNPDGTLAAVIPGGWNRVKNIQDQTLTALPNA